jgi:RND superfamily putative drug exporter
LGQRQSGLVILNLNKKQNGIPTFFTGHITGWCRRHRRWVLFGWLLFAILTIGACLSVGPNEDFEYAGQGESAEATELYQERFDVEEASLSETIVFSHPSLTVNDAEYQETVEGLLGDLQDLRSVETETIGETNVVSSLRVFTGTFSHYDIGLPREYSPLVAQNEEGGDVTFANAEYANELEDPEGEVDTITETVATAADESGFEILIGGGATVDKQIMDMVNEDSGFASVITTPLALLILLAAFGALVAAGVPILVAYLGVLITAGVVCIVSYAVPMTEIWIQVVLLMGLAAGIDYMLFLLTRFHQEREQGSDSKEASITASHTAGKGVFIAGATTILAVNGMFLANDRVFSSLGLAAVLSIIVALVMALTFTPSILGNWLSRLNIPKIGRRFNIAEAGRLNPLAGRLVRRSARHRWIVGTLVLASMLALGSLIFSFNLGFNGARSYHDDIEAKAAVRALEENFTIGLLSPATVVVDPGESNNIFAADVQDKVNSFIQSVRDENTRAQAAGEHVPFAEPIHTSINRAGDTEVIDIPINADTGDQEALDAVTLLREELIPEAFPDDSVRALVAGWTAGNVDFTENIGTRTPFVVAFVVLTAFLVLVFLYRSLVIPLIAVLLNLVAVGAAYGVLVLVFQEGYALEGLLQFEATGIIEVWVPLFIFCITFGISMDYLTFAIGRVQELHHRGWRTEDAIVEGVRGSFGVVFSAAAIMIMVAGVFSFTRFLAMQQFGFALALAVLFDATIVLVVLLPAMMRMANERLWYLPSWLNWIPGGHTKGDETEAQS